MLARKLFNRLGLSIDPLILKRFLPYLKPFRRLLAGASLLLLAASVLQLSTPLLTGYIIDRILAEKRAEILTLIIPLILLLTVAYLLSNIVRAYMLMKLRYRLSLKLHQHQLRQLARLSFTFTCQKETGYLATRVTEDAGGVLDFVTGDLVSFLHKVFTLLAALAAMAWLSWRTALLSVLVIPAYVLLGSIFVDRLRRLSREGLETSAQRQKVLHESLAGMYTVNACAAEAPMLGRFLQSQTKLVRVQMRQFWISSKVTLTRSLVAASGPLIVLWYGGMEVIAGRMSIGGLIAFSAVFGYLFEAAKSLSTTHLTLQKVIVSLERLLEILDRKPAIEAASHPRVLHRVEQGIHFEEVGFSYDGSRQALKGLNLWVPAGKIVALAGHSGAGKTTIAHLLMRFYDPQEGRILIDGCDLKSFSLRSLRRKIALVPQDVFLFSMSVEDNIRLGDPSAGFSRVERAARLANAHEFITRLPHGYRTPVGERGTTLSGGQRQRIAIARALLMEPQVLLLDEAVSAVDGTSEQKICETVRRLNAEEDLTILTIAHRLSTIQQSDRIYLIREGCAVAQGSHHVLIRNSPDYAELIRFQYGEAEAPFDKSLARAG
ncbi:MAG TPA: ABC transporter ATP-binding protein [Acidobacteriota bacterium]|nr:ABC transporter ATP-binding protein [Acidobacteriota bacterium]